MKTGESHIDQLRYRFMPRQNEVVLIGIKGSFREIKVLENYGPDNGVLQIEGQDKALDDILWKAELISDHAPLDKPINVLVCDVFASTGSNLPILPQASCVLLLTVSSEDGEMGIADIRKHIGYTSISKDSAFDFYQKGDYPEYDQLLIARVLGHGFPH